MLFLEWEEKYSVGVEELDKQHKVLVDILNELFDAMLDRKGNEVLGKMISKMLDSTRAHFSREEKLMEKYGYPDLPLQRNEHRLFIEKILVFKSDFDGGRKLLSVKIITFFKTWLSQHFSTADKRYAQFFYEKGLS